MLISSSVFGFALFAAFGAISSSPNSSSLLLFAGFARNSNSLIVKRVQYLFVPSLSSKE
jgi:hypothetical protein